ncbi:ATP-binding cassette domain-containing protein [Iocasia frigidifontis]|uniref:ATP-binding cassette domain-containing protein n=1 Tax=Iocasia fonsfrigidae TaxID=2682810 RepID=A0A8A7KBZ1_9FIRM|nr:sugar ABC transporter ATP-binding protein [Iocasia fonsfrigidae]QTL97605.1 ATP-binding cassette domain-containing protein [Iocasia fonsfrigidae]
MEKGNPLLKIDGISKSFYGTQALKDVSLEISSGEIHAICGENGAGKSTLMNVMTGIIQADSGEMYFEGEKLVDLSPRLSQGKGISIVHQELSLCQHMSVAENIFMGRVPTKKNEIVDFKKMRQDSAGILERLATEIDPATAVRDLSLSQQQMVEIAKALSINTKILILDEPTSSLTDTEAQTLFKNLRRLKEDGIAIFFISHRLNEIFEICDTYTVLRDGELIESGSIKDVSPDDIVRLMVGRELSNAYPDKGTTVGKTVLEVKNISCEDLFSNISFSVKEKEILGIFGLVGAGRSEVARAIFGIAPIDEGELVLFDQDITSSDVNEKIAEGLVYITEDRKTQGLFLNMDIQANIIAADLEQVSKGNLLDNKLEKSLSNKYVEEMNTRYSSLKQPVKSLSGGNQQKVLLGKWLAVNPRVIILDEPTRGIDVGAKFEIHSKLRELSEKGHGIVVISSELPEILGISDRILIMHQGEIVGELSAEEATEEKIMMYASGRKREKN